MWFSAVNEIFELLTPYRARTQPLGGTTRCYYMKGLQIRVSSGSWSPHSNLCSALAATRATARAGRTTSFGQVSLQRQLVSRARQPGSTKNGRRSCRTRGERPRRSASAARILIFAFARGRSTRCPEGAPQAMPSAPAVDRSTAEQGTAMSRRASGDGDHRRRCRPAPRQAGFHARRATHCMCHPSQQCKRAA